MIFEEAFDACWRTHSEWMDEFARMTFEEFNRFFDYVFDERMTALMADPTKTPKSYVDARLSMLLALCTKVSEAGHFWDGADQKWRDAAEDISNIWFNFTMSILGDTPRARTAKVAWEAHKDYCERFGYKSGPVFKALAPA